jgi:hypothetical protein
MLCKNCFKYSTEWYSGWVNQQWKKVKGHLSQGDLCVRMASHWPPEKLPEEEVSLLG